MGGWSQTLDGSSRSLGFWNISIWRRETAFRTCVQRFLIDDDVILLRL
jgi:hypothetical protein